MKEMYQNVKQAIDYLVHLKLFWITLGLGLLVLYLTPDPYQGTVMSRGTEGGKVSLRNQMVAYKDIDKEYSLKTGHTLTPDQLSSKDFLDSADKNAKMYKGLYPDQVYSRFLFKPYTLNGQVIMKIKMDQGPDFMEISTGAGIYGIYFLDALPPEVKGENVKVSGVIYGTIVSGKTKETALVSSYKAVEPITVQKLD